MRTRKRIVEKTTNRNPAANVRTTKGAQKERVTTVTYLQQRGTRKARKAKKQRVYQPGQYRELKGERWIENMINPRFATQIPRPVPTETAPHCYRLVQTIETPAGGHGACIVYPSYWNTLQYFQPFDNFTGELLSSELRSRDNINSATHADWIIAPNIQCSASVGVQHSIRKIRASADMYTLLNSDGQYLSHMLEYYPGTFNFSTTSQPFSGLTIYNEDNAAMDYSVTIGSYDPTTGFITPHWSAFGEISRDSSTQPSTNPTDTTSFQNMVILFTITNPQTIGNVPSGMKFQLALHSGVNASLLYQGDGAWLNEDFTQERHSSATAISQFQNAQKISFIGQSALLSDVSEVQLTGGAIRAAQLPAGSYSLLSQDPRSLFDYCGKVTRMTQEPGLLKDGKFGSWCPDELQDLHFKYTVIEKQQASNNIKDRPFMLFAWQAPANAAAELSFTTTLLTEHITDDISDTSYMGPADLSNFMNCYLMLRKRHLCWSENPSHWENIKGWTKTIASDPTFQELVKKVGMTAATALLALI